MVFYRYTGNDDLWLGKYGKSEKTLIPNELLTQSELNSVKTKCPRLNIDKTFKAIDIPKSKTYSMFGARFEDGTDHNSKLESKRMTIKKLRIKEDRDYNDSLKRPTIDEMRNKLREFATNNNRYGSETANTVIAKESITKSNSVKYMKESDYGYTQNGEEIDESTVEELYRMAEYELLPQSELARVFGADNISINEDTFEYYATGTAWGAYMKYDILIDVNTGSYGNRFDLNKFINPNYDDIRPDFDVKDVSFDIVVKVDGDEVTAEVDLNPRNINIEGDITDWYAKRFSKMLDIEAIEKDVETIAERDVYEIKSVLSNI